jgi:hypothetical protein
VSLTIADPEPSVREAFVEEQHPRTAPLPSRARYKENGRERSMSLVHFDYDRISTLTQHQPFALGLQMHHHTLSVLQP